MRRIALGVFVLLLVAPAQSAQGARADSGAHQSALRLLEPALTVPGVATATLTTTRTTLRKGARYKLVVTGTVFGSITRPDGVTIGETEDAFYCFAELNGAPSIRARLAHGISGIWAR
jgi:hypothetical protein